MNKNIIIIAVAAITAFLAVLLIPRLLDRDAGEQPEPSASSDSSAGTDSAGSDSAAPRQTGDTDNSAQPAGNAGSPNPALEAQLAEAARQVNAGISADGPVVIDELTRMTSARSEGIRIQYRYAISRQLNAAQTRQFRQFASTQNQQTICARPETRELIDMGGEIEYVYYGPGDSYLFSTPITGC